MNQATALPTRDPAAITIVSGLPRSGTSMMMRMLEMGGLSVLTDNLRTADTDNPEGYYEFERVKDLPKGDTAWLPAAQGKVVKVIAALLEHLPPGYAYRVIFMQRQMAEMLASQEKMLARRGVASNTNPDDMARLFEKHVSKVKAWMAERPYFSLLDVDYNRLLAEPWPQVEALNAFLGGTLDVEKMAEVVNPALYRNRADAAIPPPS